MSILIWQLILLVILISSVILLIRFLKNRNGINPSVILLFLFFSLIFSSCMNEDQNMLMDPQQRNSNFQSKEELDNYILARLGEGYAIVNDTIGKRANQDGSDSVSLVLNTKEELDEFLKEISYSKAPLKSVGLIENSKSGVTTRISELYSIKERFNLSSLTTVVVGFYLDENCEGSDLNSWIEGFTLGVSYHHLQGRLYSRKDQMCFKVAGMLNYNIIVEGIGTVFSETKEFDGCTQCPS